MLEIYPSPIPGTAFSSDTTFTNPLAVSIDGQTGLVLAKKLYLRNDDITKYYTTISVQPIINSGTDIVSGATDGYTWKLIAGDTEPNEIQWSTISPAAAISLSDIGESGIGDITTFLPFWLRIEVPRGVSVQVFQNASLQVTANEENV